MQTFSDKPSDFLYDGMSAAAQDFMRNPIPSIQAVKQRGSSISAFSGRRLLTYASKTTILLIVCWIWLLLWGEKKSFELHISKCSWERWEKWETSAKPHHMILLADPQLVDPHTYPDRPWPLSTITMKHTDQYLRRSFEALDDRLDPETIFFLGDLFDGGREWSTGTTKSPESRWHKYGPNYWLAEYDRFGKIYHEPWLRSSLTSAHENRKFISTIPGNHDLGLGHGIQIPVRDRFETYFGHGNRIDTIANHTFVSIDSVSLSAKLQFEPENGIKPNAALWEPTERFLSDIRDHKQRVASRDRRLQLHKQENALQKQAAVNMDSVPSNDQWTVKDNSLPETPTIILSHVPFWREPDTPCGPQRERHPPSSEPYDPDRKDSRNAIAVAYGYQYQNVLAKELSSRVVKSIGNVKHIFSGDDHDYCALVHKDLDPDQSSIPEITVKSTSWAMGVRKPGFLLVSLWNPLDGPAPAQRTIQTHLCLLPDQLGIFIRYLQLILITLAVLAVRSFILRRSLLSRLNKEEALLPTPVTTPTYPRQSDSGSYSSSSSNGKGGVAARSGAGRQSFSQSNGNGSGNISTSPALSLGDYLSPSRAYSPAHTNPNDEKWKPSSVSTRRIQTGRLGRPDVRDFFKSIIQVASAALLWYWWLARTV